VAGKNHFELLGLPAGFDLDPSDLSTRYRALQQQLHPDRHSAGTDADRRLALQLTASLNDAYQTLRDPVRRAGYLLQLSGAGAQDETDTRLSPAFLMEQMELRESLADLRQHADPRTKLAELAGHTERMMQEKIADFRRAYARGRDGLETARHVAREMQFIDKLRREIGEREEELA
jgi:molecular chaperone HscB